MGAALTCCTGCCPSRVAAHRNRYESLLNGQQMGFRTQQTRAQQLERSMREAQQRQDDAAKQNPGAFSDPDFNSLIMSRDQQSVQDNPHGKRWLDDFNADPSHPMTYNAFKTWLEPFPSTLKYADAGTKAAVIAKNGFHTNEINGTKWLPFQYDKLVSMPPQRSMAMSLQHEAPTFAVFHGIDPKALSHFSVGVYVFVGKNGAAFHPPAKVQDYFFHDSFAGDFCLFGGRGMGAPTCQNCVTRGAVADYRIDLSDALKRQSLYRSQSEVHVMVCVLPSTDEDPPQPTPAEAFNDARGKRIIPEPIVAGPRLQIKPTSHRGTWLHATTEEEANANQIVKDDVKIIQQHLALMGFYDVPADGWFGPVTKAAVEEFQTNNMDLAGKPLEVTGLLDPKTLARLYAPAYDAKPHAHVPADKATYMGRKSITIFVCMPPSYMDRAAVVEEIMAAAEKWSEAIGIEITESKNPKRADIHIGWGYTEVPAFSDGIAGELARATDRAIEFDRAERWCMIGEKGHPGQLSFQFYPVVLHELG